MQLHAVVGFAAADNINIAISINIAREDNAGIGEALDGVEHEAELCLLIPHNSVGCAVERDNEVKITICERM